MKCLCEKCCTHSRDKGKHNAFWDGRRNLCSRYDDGKPKAESGGKSDAEKYFDTIREQLESLGI